MAAQAQTGAGGKKTKSTRKPKVEVTNPADIHPTLIALPFDTAFAADTTIFMSTEEEMVEELVMPQALKVVDSFFLYTDTTIQWLTIEEGLARQQKTNAKLLVYVYAQWCKWCKAMDTVFAHKEIAHYINQQFIPVKFNAETKTAVSYRGQTYRFLPDMKDFVHELTLTLLNGKQSYPGFVVINENTFKVDVSNGFMDAIRFENYLNYYGSNAYKHSSYDVFNHDFHGRVK